MNTSQMVSWRSLLIAAALLLGMWATRSHHFATLTSLPDASWAAFFVAGLFTSSWWIPAVLLLNAGAIDYLALLGGVSDYCVTPAYPFLIPTYLTLWAAGRWAGLQRRSPLRTTASVVVACVVGVTGAFVISNASFYAFSGYFADMSAGAYAWAVAQYWPHFLESTSVYTLVSLLVAFLTTHFARRADSPHAHQP